MKRVKLAANKTFKKNEVYQQKMMKNNINTNSNNNKIKNKILDFNRPENIN